MTAEESRELTFGEEETAEHSFDQLARELADGTLSRRRALKMIGTALVGSVLASVPGLAWAAKPAPCPSGVKCGKNCCPNAAFICAKGQCACPAGTTRIGDTCCEDVNVCGSSCGCQTGESCVNQTCVADCPPNEEICNGSCVPKCPADQVLDQATCECICPSGTISTGTISPCQSGSDPGLTACCPPEGHIACCGGFIQDPTPTLPVVGEYIGCINNSCPGGCVIMATSPGDLLGSNAGRCITAECSLCRTDSGGLGCFRFNPDGSVQCDPL